MRRGQSEHIKKGGVPVSMTVRQWRLAKEITIGEMADACGVHYNTYAKWEEEPGKISIDAAKKIANALGESVNTIFFGDDSTNCSV